MKKTTVIRSIIIIAAIALVAGAIIFAVVKKGGGSSGESNPTDFVLPISTPPAIPHLSVSENSLAYGNKIVIGSYEQNGNTEDGKEPIEWTVANAFNSGGKRKALLVSNECLFVAPYNDVRVSTSWADSTLRDYLNEEFLNEAFTKEEKEYLFKANISNLPVTSYGDVDAGKMTEDFVFIPDYSNYLEFGNFVSGKASYTEAAKAEAEKHENIVENSWWVRNPGVAADRAVVMVNDAEMVLESGEYVDLVCGVRVAVWVIVG